LMHPRTDCRYPAQSRMLWSAAKSRRVQLLLDFVRERGEVHPRDADDHFSHGKVKNYWGGNSNATTHLLDAMHYQGLLRVVRRENGIRVYAVQEHASGPTDDESCRARLDALIDVAVRIYAPLPRRQPGIACAADSCCCSAMAKRIGGRSSTSQGTIFARSGR